MSETVSLRPWVAGDATRLAALANDPSIWNRMRDSFPHPFTEADAHAQISQSQVSAVVTSRAILLGDDIVGCITLERRDDVRKHSALLSYWIGAEYRGRGIATRAIKAMTRVAFEDLALHRVYAKVHATNAASTRALENAGYLHEGTFRDAVLKNGVLQDQVLYAMVSSS